MINKFYNKISRRNALAFLIIMAGLCVSGRGFYVGAKAATAQVLLKRAWAQSLETGEQANLWGSMDARPFAKLTVPSQGESAIVLDNLSGQSLAFAPSYMPETAKPGMPGTSLIAAHKNTHFAFLENLQKGDEIHVQNYDGSEHVFRVSHMQIVDKDQSGIYAPDTHISSEEPSRLALVTCYPFDQLSYGGPLRYIVFAEEVPKTDFIETEIVLASTI
ncbi:MAG: class GN sortase [Maricaulaceae bacterium]